MEELAEGLLKTILRFIRWFLLEAICERFLYWLGRLFLLAVTFGAYPNAQQQRAHQGRIIFTGLLVAIVIVVLISFVV
ncbi:hypothetical protein [Thalassotalea sp. PLHSN55]|uniref:hypothetical protein n=1 Tax=Thalassotalea sp. PLHSN55 TaxID=3435888 RepID=UPI003F86EF9F